MTTLKPFVFRMGRTAKGGLRIISGAELEAIQKREAEERHRYLSSLPKMEFLGILCMEHAVYGCDEYRDRLFKMGVVPSDVKPERGDIMALVPDGGYAMPYLRFPEAEKVVRELAAKLGV